MKKIFIYIWLILIFSINSYACTCIGGEPSIKESIQNSHTIFVGTVIKCDTFNVVDNQTGEKVWFIKYQIKSDFFLKHHKKLKIKVLSVITGLGNGDCGFGFEMGKKYIIYAQQLNKYYPSGKEVAKYLYTDTCMRTKLYSRQEENEILQTFKGGG